MTWDEVGVLLKEFEDWWTRYRAINESNTFARLNATAWAGESLAPRLAQALSWAINEADEMNYRLIEAYENGYLQAFEPKP